jgi:predicted DNA-binding transcriptional regulator AlpA
MSNALVTLGSTTHPKYARASATCLHFQISRSKLWNWVKKQHGFPSPIKAEARVTLFAPNAIDDFIKVDAVKKGSAI